MKLFFKKFDKSSSGFTLVETLVAVSIFTVSTLGLMVFLGKSMADTGYAKKKTTAAYLAQEGIEYIRNLRDTHILYSSTSSDAGWNSFVAKILSGSCQNSNGCYFNVDNINYSDSSQPIIDMTLTAFGSSRTPFPYNSATVKDGETFGANSGFIRKIYIVQTSADEMKVSSTVYWTQGSGSYNMTFSQNLLKWVEY